MRPLVLVGCGATKQAAPWRGPAANLYTGSYFRSCLSTARALADDDDVVILSARYGLLRLGDQVEPYDLTIDQRGAVSVGEVVLQAVDLGMYGRPVIALCSARYADFVAEAWVWADVRRPLAGLGIGEQRHVLAQLRGRGRLVADDEYGTPDLFSV